MTSYEINKLNGVKDIASTEILDKLSLISYFGGNLPSDTVLGSFNQEAINTNKKTNGNIPRDNSGNIISYVDSTKNKNKLSVDLITKKFDRASVEYSLDYEFVEFKNKSGIVQEYEFTITNLKDQLSMVLGKLDAAMNEIELLKSSDKTKSSALSQAQSTINNLTTQATNIADNLAKKMEDASKQSANALKEITDAVKKDGEDKKQQIGRLQSEVDKIRDETKQAKAEADAKVKAAEEKQRQAEEDKRKADEAKKKAEEDVAKAKAAEANAKKLAADVEKFGLNKDKVATAPNTSNVSNKI